MFTSPKGDLWIGSRSHGAFRHDGRQWQRYHVKDGLVANTVRGITETTDGNIWVATDRGISCFDGQTWNPTVLPAELNMPREGGTLRASPSGALWVNRSSRAWTRRAWPKSPPFDPAAGEFWTVCYQRDRDPPHTAITAGLNEVSQPGNLMIAWTGTDRWQETRDTELQFSFRLDGGSWSPFTIERTHSFFSLRSGQHHFEVRARDHSMNVDPSPATLDFEVVPPVWRQAWFITLLSLLISAIVAQTLRVILNGRHLRHTNAALSAEVEERKRIEAEMERTHKQLLAVSRRAGMAEVAVNVLHNVGNVLNSVNVSANLLSEKIRKSKVAELRKVSLLVETQAPESDFLKTHERGKLIPEYLQQLSGHLATEQQESLTEVSRMQKNIDHITSIIAQQQEHSRFADLEETAKVTDLVEDALRLKAEDLTRQRIQLVRDFQEDGTVVVKRYKVLEILDDLLREAQHACTTSGRADPQLKIRTERPGEDRVRIQIIDNGIGIPLEDRQRIFAQQFESGKDGHQLNLHDSANRARELGGTLTVDSDGPGAGACYTLEFPAKPIEGQAGSGLPLQG